MSTTTTVSLEMPRALHLHAINESIDLQSRPQDAESNRVYVPVYSRFSKAQKRSITAFLAFCGLVASTSTTSVLSAIPEIVAAFETTAPVINISNALYLLFMGVSSCLWGPWSDIFGRRSAYLISTSLFFAFSLGTALSPSLEVFFVCRALTAMQGTAFLILGSSCISDIYHPIERATSLGWFLSGTMVGPAFGPLLGGIIITYQSWRVIFWLQTALAGVAVILSCFVLEETLLNVRVAELRGQSFVEAARRVWRWSNPVTVVKLYSNRNLLFIILASSSLVWNMYSLLTPIRYVLNPRLNLKTPLQSGLLYISPGAGYIVGTMIGGRWADHTVKVWTKKRGHRLPEDRLRSCLVFLGLASPAAMLAYGWFLDAQIGGIPVPVVCMFIQGVAQLSAFTSLNAYILDISQHRSGEASASHYMMRYSLAGVSTALCLPLIDVIGVGWTSTISASLLSLCAILVYWVIRCGEAWRKN